MLVRNGCGIVADMRGLALSLLLLLLPPSVCAWLPCSATACSVGNARRPGLPRASARSTPLRASVEGAAGQRADLRAMKQGFERVGWEHIMEYIQELRARKQLLLSRLEETGGMITEDIYPIMEELAQVNPSPGGRGARGDPGKDYYSANLRGQWIAASTIVPDVPFVYGKGEAGPTESPDPSSLPSNGEGPTCTLAQLSAAIYGHECGGDYDSEVHGQVL